MKRELMESILRELNSKVPIQACPMCGSSKRLGMAEGMMVHVLYENALNPYVYQNKSIPTIAVMCDNCGYLMQYAVKALVPNWDEIKNEIDGSVQ